MGDGPLTRHRARPRLYPMAHWERSGSTAAFAQRMTLVPHSAIIAGVLEHFKVRETWAGNRKSPL